MSKHDELPVHAFATPKAFATWLAKHHDEVPAIRIRFAKRASGIRSINYLEALEVALCHGWIDGQAKSEGDATYVQWFGKRKPKSIWSKVNCARVEQLIADGKMKPAGLAEIERAKADGRWAAAYEPPSRATIPEDLAAALAKQPKAAAFFATLDSRNRYAVLHRLMTAKKPETRARRLEQFVAMLAKGEKLHA